MTGLGNEEMTTDGISEIKDIVTNIKENMMSEKDCNNQLYTIIQTLDGIGTYLEQLQNNNAGSADGFTVLQTNILEVRNEIARLNQSVDATNLAEFEPLVAKLTEKVNRLDIIANNSGIDKQVLMNVSAQLEQNLSAKLNENSETLFNQSSQLKSDIEILNENLKDGVQYLERALKANAGTGDGSNLKSLSEDLVLLSSNIEKSNNNLKKSMIDLFSKIQENINTVNFSKVTGGGGGVNAEALQANLEMLKNGLYNVNVNSTQQYNKMLQVLSEFEAYKNLEKFAKISSLPAIGDMKTALYKNLASIVSEFAAQFETNQPNTIAEQLTENVYNEFVAMLSNVSGYVVEAEKNEENTISDKIDELLPFTKESIKDIKDLICDLKRGISCLQSGDEETEYTYSMQDMESDAAKIRIYLNELGQHVNTLAQKDVSEDLNNIYLTLDSINQKVQKNEKYKITDNINKIQEDVLSISSRVNTLLLSSDKDSEALNASLVEFKALFKEINDELKSQTHIEHYNNIETALERVNTVLQENKGYNELINQSLVMLAEWVDNAGESLTNISARLGGGIESIKIPEAIDYTAKIEALEQLVSEQNLQIAQQQSYINAMDEKLGVILGQNQQIALQEEKLRQIDERITTVLEFSAKNDSAVVMQKMNNIDAKLEKLNNSIGKLTSYVDEE